MTRKEHQTGLDIKEWLIHEVSRGDIEVQDIFKAMGISRTTFNRYINQGRGETFPNEEEIDLLVKNLNLTERYGLTAEEIKVRFGVVTLADIEEARERYEELRKMEHLLNHPSRATSRKEVTVLDPVRGRVAKDAVRSDTPPL